MPTPESKQLIPLGFPIFRIMNDLRAVCGVVAVVVGGSWGAGFERPDSDVDSRPLPAGDLPPG